MVLDPLELHGLALTVSSVKNCLDGFRALLSWACPGIAGTGDGARGSELRAASMAATSASKAVWLEPRALAPWATEGPAPKLLLKQIYYEGTILRCQVKCIQVSVTLNVQKHINPSSH
jgi:hypothetical protein